MPYEMDPPDGKLCNFTGLLTTAQIDRLAAHKALETLQFDAPVDPRNWARLEECLFRKRHDVALRIYGHDDLVPNVSFVQEMPSLRRFFADCLRRAVGLEAVRHLSLLKELSVGIDEIATFDFLAEVSPGLEKLRLDRTRSQNLSLEALGRFKSIRELTLSGQTKELHRLAPLQTLEVLVLWHQKSPSLDFLGSFSKLKLLEFNLGSSRDLSKIADAKRLRRLELHGVRQISDLGFLSRCESLKELVLDNLAQVRTLPDLRPLKKLRWLSLSSRTAIRDLSPVGMVPALESFSSGGIAGLAPKDFWPVLRAPALKHAGIYFASQRKQQEFDEKARSVGISCE